MAKVFCLDQHNNYVETMTKEDIIAAIQTAAAGGELEGFSNAAVVTKIKEINKNSNFSVWVGTAAEYNALATKPSNVLFILSDDPLGVELPNKIQNLQTAFENTTKKAQDLQLKCDELQIDRNKLREYVDESLETSEKNIENMITETETRGLRFCIYENEEGEETAQTTEPITNFDEFLIVFKVYDYEVDGSKDWYSVHCNRQFVEFLGDNTKTEKNTFHISCVDSLWSYSSYYRQLSVAAQIEFTTTEIYTMFAIKKISAMLGSTNYADRIGVGIHKIYGITRKQTEA